MSLNFKRRAPQCDRCPKSKSNARLFDYIKLGQGRAQCLTAIFNQNLRHNLIY